MKLQVALTISITSNALKTTYVRPQLTTRLFSSSTMEPLRPARLSVEPEFLVNGIPQLAKDVDYAQAIQTAWKDEIMTRSADDAQSESCPYTYVDAKGESCYGHIVRTNDIKSDKKVPGVIFFHTGAGPHDVCLHWKADSLVTNTQVFPEGCVVLIADILSDDTGWAWSPDRTKYNDARAAVLDDRSKLRVKLNAALEQLVQIEHVDSSRLVAMGWCLGGHSILEFARMKPKGIKAMVTFHGVFDGIPVPTTKDEIRNDGYKILICHGAEDPFVSAECLKNAMDTMKGNGHDVALLELNGAKHGFTNPAQDFHSNYDFRFNKEGADKAWSSTIDLLRSVL